VFHESFRDFLIDPDLGSSKFRLDELKCHERIAESCLRLLNSKDPGCDRDYLRRNICDLKMPGTARMEVAPKTTRESLPPHVQHACQYWVHRLKQSNRPLKDEKIYRFLKRHFLPALARSIESYGEDRREY